ncbi:MAG TPA: RNA polymerase sigma factor region1.1 domain-containing protein, partial [Rhodoferax sp.]
MPAQNTKKPVQSPAKPLANAKPAKVAPAAAPKSTLQNPDKKDKLVIASKSPAKASSVELKKTAATAVAAEVIVKKKPGRPPKAATVESDAALTPAAKRGRKAKNATELASKDDLDMADIEADLVGEPVATGEKVKPLRMKISKAKERALMKEFGLDETVLSEEDMAKRRQRLKALIKLGKTRGYLTHGEISDHLPDKLVDAETLEVVISMLNDMGVAVYEQTPDAETLLLNNNVSTAATEEEAEEEAEAALSTVDSEFGRTTDPVRMYMREMGTVELLTREGEIEIAKRIEGGLMAMMEAISASPATIAEILRLSEDIREGKVVITTIVDGFSNPNEADDYVAEEDFDEFDA